MSLNPENMTQTNNNTNRPLPVIGEFSVAEMQNPGLENRESREGLPALSDFSTEEMVFGITDMPEPKNPTVYNSRPELESVMAIGATPGATIESGESFFALVIQDPSMWADNLGIDVGQLREKLFGGNIKTIEQQIVIVRQLLRNKILSDFDTKKYNPEELSKSVKLLVSVMMYAAVANKTEKARSTNSQNIQNTQSNTSQTSNNRATGTNNSGSVNGAGANNQAANTNPNPNANTNPNTQQGVGNPPATPAAPVTQPRAPRVAPNDFDHGPRSAASATVEDIAGRAQAAIERAHEDIASTEGKIQSLDRRIGNMNRYLFLLEQATTIEATLDALRAHSPEYGKKVAANIESDYKELVNRYKMPANSALKLLLQGGQLLVGTNAVNYAGLIPSGEQKLKRLATQKQYSEYEIYSDGTTIAQCEDGNKDALRNLVIRTGEIAANQSTLRRRVLAPLAEKFFARSKSNAATSNSKEIKELKEEYEVANSKLYRVQALAAEVAVQEKWNAMTDKERAELASRGITEESLVQRYLKMKTNINNAMIGTRLQNEMVDLVRAEQKSEDKEKANKTLEMLKQKSGVARIMNWYQQADGPVMGAMKRAIETTTVAIGATAASGTVQTALGYGLKAGRIARIALVGGAAFVLRDALDLYNLKERKDIAALNKEAFKSRGILGGIVSTFRNRSFGALAETYNKYGIPSLEKKIASKLSFDDTKDYLARTVELEKFAADATQDDSMRTTAIDLIARYSNLMPILERRALENTTDLTSQDKKNALQARIEQAKRYISDRAAKGTPIPVNILEHITTYIANLEKMKSGVVVSDIAKLQDELSRSSDPERVLEIRRQIESKDQANRIRESAKRWLTVGSIIAANVCEAVVTSQHNVPSEDLGGELDSHETVRIPTAPDHSDTIPDTTDSQPPTERLFADGRTGNHSDVPIGRAHDVVTPPTEADVYEEIVDPDADRPDLTSTDTGSDSKEVWVKGNKGTPAAVVEREVWVSGDTPLNPRSPGGTVPMQANGQNVNIGGGNGMGRVPNPVGREMPIRSNFTALQGQIANRQIVYVDVNGVPTNSASLTTTSAINVGAQFRIVNETQRITWDEVVDQNAAYRLASNGYSETTDVFAAAPNSYSGPLHPLDGYGGHVQTTGGRNSSIFTETSASVSGGVSFTLGAQATAGVTRVLTGYDANGNPIYRG